jgi:undecaprenyl-diphosphatase
MSTGETTIRVERFVDRWAHRFEDFSPHTIALMLWAALGAGCVAILVVLSVSLGPQSYVTALDERVMVGISDHLRSPFLSAMMVDATALGSLALMIVFSVVSVILLVSIKDPAAAIHLVVTVAVSYAISIYTKGLFERPRPSIVPQLIKASGFSYPSGHSVSSAALYVTLAILAARHVSTHKARLTLASIAVLMISLVSFSRVYLGVHYPSDTIGGAAMGSAWALVMAAFFSKRYWGPRASTARASS